MYKVYVAFRKYTNRYPYPVKPSLQQEKVGMNARAAYGAHNLWLRKGEGNPSEVAYCENRRRLLREFIDHYAAKL